MARHCAVIVGGLLAALSLSCAPSPPTAIASQTVFEPTWESLHQYQVPDWYQDAKFGIFIHWGAYAVPAHGSEWYPRNMYNRESELFAYHRKTWGDQGTFGYKDFIPAFRAEKWDPEAWADLFARAGARYVIPVAEHHDGFAMYASTQTKWNAADMGPHRDVCGELAQAVRKRHMKFGVSSHYAWNWRYYFYEDGFDTVNPAYAGLYGRRHDPDAPADATFLAHWEARTRELIDRYRPDVLWFDFGFCWPEFEPGRRRLAAYYYNQQRAWGKGVALNYKRWTKPEQGVTERAFPEGTGVLDLEREKSPTIRPFFWQTDTAISKKSWGYIENDVFKSPDALIDDLVDIVSKNGCLLLNVGPRADGTIPQEAQDILLAMGAWLQANGTAIYGTRPWLLSGEGPTGTAEGHLSENKNQPFTARDIRFTQDGRCLYAILLDWPADGRVTIQSLGSGRRIGTEGVESVTLLGHEAAPLTWTRSDAGLTVALPARQVGRYAHVLTIKPRGDLIKP